MIHAHFWKFLCFTAWQFPHFTGEKKKKNGRPQACFFLIFHIRLCHFHHAIYITLSQEPVGISPHLSSNHFFTQTIYTLEPVVLSGSSSLLPRILHPYITFPIASGRSACWQSHHPPSVHPADVSTLPFEDFSSLFSCLFFPSSSFYWTVKLSSNSLAIDLDFLRCHLLVFKVD